MEQTTTRTCADRAAANWARFGASGFELTDAGEASKRLGMFGGPRETAPISPFRLARALHPFCASPCPSTVGGA